MFRPAAIVLASLLAVPAVAEEAAAKKESCTYQSQVVAAIQEARKNRVKEQDVPAAIAATNPTWPEQYNNAIPLVTPWVYEQKMRTIRRESLADAWLELCLEQ
ncbi:hypothetical protein [Chachezhania sediminis]|uniref:hypothetical protein n=1 Tax=Chachezhania sediminis TaxID=2599291 RepID=UPI00131C908E|nr:hypothetical protein [Chachezhania sediminis]